MFLFAILQLNDLLIYCVLSLDGKGAVVHECGFELRDPNIFCVCVCRAYRIWCVFVNIDRISRHHQLLLAYFPHKHPLCCYVGWHVVMSAESSYMRSIITTHQPSLPFHRSTHRGKCTRKFFSPRTRLLYMGGLYEFCNICAVWFAGCHCAQRAAQPRCPYKVAYTLEAR